MADTRFPISKKRYNVAYFHTEDGAVKIPDIVADYICQLENEIVDRNTRNGVLQCNLDKLNSQTFIQRLFNKGLK